MKVTIPLVALIGALPLACAPSEGQPQLPSSAGQVAYAQEYPAALQSLANEQANSEGQLAKLTAEFPKYPDQLKDPPWAQVEQVVEAADSAGRSAGYADRQRNTQTVGTFFNEERDEIGRHVTGSVTYVAKKKSPTCDFEPGGTVSASLKDSVEKQLEKRLRASNEGHAILERYRESLGKANAAALEKQADSIALAAHIGFAELPMIRFRAQRLLHEGDQVKQTLDRAISDEQAIQADAARSATEKKASADRLTHLQESRGRIDSRLTETQTLVKQLDQRDADLQKQYKDALSALQSAIASKESAAAKKK